MSDLMGMLPKRSYIGGVDFPSAVVGVSEDSKLGEE
jgi:hypothetical protein